MIEDLIQSHEATVSVNDDTGYVSEISRECEECEEDIFAGETEFHILGSVVVCKKCMPIIIERFQDELNKHK